jgi:alanyl aminopeptidase
LTLTVPEGNLAVSNAPVESETRGEGETTISFRETPPLPSYLLAIAVGPFDAVPIPGMSVPGRVITPRGRSHLAAEAVRSTPPVLAALERWFDQRYPFEKLDLIAVPEFWYGAMENPGAVTYAARILLLDPATASIDERRRLASVTAHELAHMWFGDLVTMAWWDDLWLNESFASWMATRVIREVYPAYGVDVTSLRRIEAAMISDARPSTRAIRRPVTDVGNLLQAADILAYGKGEGVLDMFERWIGPEVFRDGVIEYIRANAGGNATAHDLWRFLSKASGKTVDRAMSTFLDQAGLPLVTVEPGAGGRVVLRQRRFTHHGVEPPGGARWRIPVVMKVSTAEGLRTERVLLDRTARTIELGPGTEIEWILPNAGMVGYYRWKVPAPMLADLAARSPSILEPRERVGVIGNLGALLDAGEIGGDAYLRALNGFAADPDPRVISALLGALDKVRGAFVTPDLEPAYALYLRRTLRPALERFGMAPEPGEPADIARFRPRLLDRLADEGRDERVRAYADSLARAYMVDPASVDPSLGSVVLDLAAIEGDRDLYESYRERFESAETPRERQRYLYALGCFTDPGIVEDALRYAVRGPLRPMEIFTVVRAIRKQHRFDERVFEWMIDNHDVLSTRMPDEFASMLPWFGGGCSPDRLERARAFFSDPAHRVPGTERTLAKVADQVEDCTELREREGPAVRAWLEAVAAGPDSVSGAGSG